MVPYARVYYNLTLRRLQSRLQHILVMNNPMPESTLIHARVDLIPPVRDFGFGHSKRWSICVCLGLLPGMVYVQCTVIASNSPEQGRYPESCLIHCSQLRRLSSVLCLGFFSRDSSFDPSGFRNKKLCTHMYGTKCMFFYSLQTSGVEAMKMIFNYRITFTLYSIFLFFLWWYFQWPRWSLSGSVCF